MSSMSIKTFINVATHLPVTTSVLIRGPHGIGKSQVISQLAATFNLALIDRRLSQMTEGDVLGLPSTDGETTRFNPPDWLKSACDHPTCLFLDEINRATPEVMQAAFQIVLDREINGWKLHPETRVFAAINSSSNYIVNEMDPALLDRFWTIDLTPTVEDWVVWARGEGKGRIPDSMIDFIASNEKWLDSPVNTEQGKINPSRRSWERCGAALKNLGIDEQPKHELFYPMCIGYVGVEATIAYHSFVSTYENQVTGEDIINDYSDVVRKKISKLGQEKQNIAIEKVADYVTKNLKTLDDNQGANLRDFMNDLPGELRVSAWSKLTSGTGTDNLEMAKSVHKWCVNTILEVFGVEAGAAIKALGNVGAKLVEEKAEKKGKKQAQA